MKLTYKHLPRLFVLLDRYKDEDVIRHFFCNEDISEIKIDFAHYLARTDNPTLFKDFLNKFDLVFAKEEENMFSVQLDGDFGFKWKVYITEDTPNIHALLTELSND